MRAPTPCLSGHCSKSRVRARWCSGLQVATVRNHVNYLKYITKYDRDPLRKGISYNQLSFYCRTIQYAERCSEYDPAHPFVLNHPQYHNLIRQVVDSVQRKQNRMHKRPFREFAPAEGEHLQEWQLEVVAWWNDWVRNGYVHKKRQLYLFGPSNTGKTSFIHRILSTCINSPGEQDAYAYESQVFRPTPNDAQFAWQEFNKDQFSLCVVDEFDIKDYHVSDFKKLTAGEPLIANVKGKSSRKICLQMPMIFISNLKPPHQRTNTLYRGVLTRLKQVSTRSDLPEFTLEREDVDDIDLNAAAAYHLNYHYDENIVSTAAASDNYEHTA